MTQTTVDLFLQRLHTIIPPTDLDRVMASFSQPKPVAFRINTLKNTVEAVITRLQADNFTITPIGWSAITFTIPFQEREKLTRHRLFLDGDIYIQSLASQIPPFVLNPQPHEEILDLTAAPGSKTTQIAALMQNTGRIAAVEMAKPRFFKLKANIALQGATEVDCYLKDGARVGKVCPERFDRVLLDAPCSSEGRFDFNTPETYAYWSQNKIKAMTKKQWPLLQSAFAALKPGGILVYSTCTFAPEENEMIVQKLLDHFDTASLSPIEIAIPKENKMRGLLSFQKHVFDNTMTNVLRVLPNHVMDGFFVAKIVKN